MAIMQMLLIIVAFVRRYDFALERDETVNIHPMMLLRPDGPIHMRFQPR
jgi:cytochrome P450